MRRYEIVLITDPDLSDNDRDSLMEKFKETIQQQEGALLKIEDWGQKRLAYDIKKKPRGYYTLLDFCGTGPLINALEHLFRIDDKVLKFMTVLLDKEVDIEAAKEGIAREEAAREQALKEKSGTELESESPPAGASEQPLEQSSARNPPEKQSANNEDTSNAPEKPAESSPETSEENTGKEQ